MYTANTLSHAYLPDISTCKFSRDLEGIDHTHSLSVRKELLHKIMQRSTEDPVFKVLRETIIKGWPERNTEVPECVHAYYDIWDELVTQDQIVLKGHHLVISRKEMMELTHATHISVEGCIQQAWESMLWPQVSTELKEYISKCDTCLAHRTTQNMEPLLQHEVLAHLWSKVVADLCELHGWTLLVVLDYCSN